MLVIAASMSASRGLGLFLEERRGGHDLAGLAVAALRHVERQPRLLHGMVAIAREALDGDDLVARLHVLDQDGAGALHLAVDVNGAGPALGDAAPVLGAGEPGLLAQGPKKRCIAVDLQIDGFAVHVELGHVLFPPFKCTIQRGCERIVLVIRLQTRTTSEVAKAIVIHICACTRVERPQRVGAGGGICFGGLANRPTAIARATYWAMQL